MAHSLPASESFADSAIGTAGDRWTLPTLYWPCQAWLSGSDPTGLAHTFVWGKLHDYYHRTTGLVTPVQIPADAGPDIERTISAFVLRTDQRDDTEVRISHVFQNVTGDGGDDFLLDGNTYAGLGARIHGAVGTDFTVNAGYTEALRSPSGYWFIWGTTGGGTSILYFKFLKVTGPGAPAGASTITELATITYFSSGTESVINPGDAQDMRFTAVTNGGTVELRGFWTQPSTGIELAVLSHDDSSSPFLVAGHPGFWLGTEILDPTGSATSPYKIAHGISAFEVGDGAGTRVLRDEWVRTAVAEMDTAGPDQMGNTGDVVTGQFTGDQAGASAAPDWVDRIVRNSAAEKLEVDDTPAGGFHLYTDPPASPYTQSIGANVTFDTGTTGARTFALLARMAVGPSATWDGLTGTGTDKSGYAFGVDYRSSVFTATIHRFSEAGTWQAVATRILNQSGDSSTVATATPNAYLLDVANVNGASFKAGTVQLVCSIDGWAIDEWVLNLTGVSQESDGSVLDARSDRVLSGPGIGFFASSTNTLNIFVNSVTRPVAEDTLDEREQASIVIGGERDGATATEFTVPHEWPVKTLHRDYGVKIRYESSHIHRHPAASSQRRGWEISSDAAKASEIATLRAAYTEQDGVEKAFPWTTPASEAVFAVFEKDSLEVEKVGPSTYAFSIKLWEALA